MIKTKRLSSERVQYSIRNRFYLTLFWFKKSWKLGKICWNTPRCRMWLDFTFHTWHHVSGHLIFLVNISHDNRAYNLSGSIMLVTQNFDFLFKNNFCEMIYHQQCDNILKDPEQLCGIQREIIIFFCHCFNWKWLQLQRIQSVAF